MKKDKNELLRLKTLIESDRLNLNNSFSDLLVNDLTVLLEEYFDFRSIPIVTVENQGDKLNVNISLIATRIKSFKTVPKN